MKVCNQLAIIRERQGLSQKKLHLKSTVSRHTISEIELNQRVPTLRTALLLARALNCMVEDIFILSE